MAYDGNKDKKQGESPPVESAEVAALKAEVVALRAMLPAAGKLDPSIIPPGHFRNARGVAVPEKYRGAHSYKLTAPRYGAGVSYEAGEVISLTDESPGRSMVPVTSGAVGRASSSTKPVDRPSDREAV